MSDQPALPEHPPEFCQHENCERPPTCWVSYYADGGVVGAIFTCDPHQAEYTVVGQSRE